jgi:endonuclease YncB( thermonuclease family)
MRAITITALLLVVGNAAADSCKIRDCHDGDTCSLLCSGEIVKLRLHCIDAPELKQTPWGELSRDALRKRLPAGSTVEIDEIGKDRYGRTVGVIMQGGVNINLQQVHSGWAVAYPKYCAEPIYYQAQDDAERSQRGVWRSEGDQRRPWEWRASNR